MITALLSALIRNPFVEGILEKEVATVLGNIKGFPLQQEEVSAVLHILTTILRKHNECPVKYYDDSVIPEEEFDDLKPSSEVKTELEMPFGN